MNVPIEIVCVCLAPIIGLQAWTLNQVVKLKVQVGQLIALYNQTTGSDTDRYEKSVPIRHHKT